MRELRARGIIVRRWEKPIIDNYLRITIGTDEQMDRLFYALDGILK
ncbi:Histidinol-phosphate aminotransferase [bioreactor metagenome]|uniref:Histidinol-phosphate aminotransferase n=1 Tax=bioreactor metagenome TaxID=1076179 RepID=A0A645GVI9_9ZZZZ